MYKCPVSKTDEINERMDVSAHSSNSLSKSLCGIMNHRAVRKHRTTVIQITLIQIKAANGIVLLPLL